MKRLAAVADVLASLFVAVFWVWAAIQCSRSGDDLRLAVSVVFASYSIRWFLRSGEEQS